VIEGVAVAVIVGVALDVGVSVLVKV